MESETQLIRELFDLPGAGTGAVVSVYRDKKGANQE